MSKCLPPEPYSSQPSLNQSIPGFPTVPGARGVKTGISIVAALARRLLFLVTVLLLSVLPGWAQVADSTRALKPSADSLKTEPTGIENADSSSLVTEAGMPPGSLATGSSGLREPVKFAADSLILIVDKQEGDRGTLFGQSKVSYGDANLDAHRVEILFSIDELRASGMPVDTGTVGKPHFRQGSETFYGDQLAFNLQTERGRMVAARTRMDDGFIRGGVVKVLEDSTLFIKDGAYTTCSCIEDPSYTLRSSRMKIVDEKWVYTGPIQLFLFNIPMPLWLPFGFLPAQEGRRSGPLPPNYGEDERGFFLRDWGWYWAISEYLDLQVRLGLWTKGSWQVAPLFRYNRRYRYSGQLQIDYVHNRRGERDDLDFSVIKTRSLRWNHNQTLSPSASFSGDVNLSSANYLRTVSNSYDDRVRQTIQSSIRYNKRWANAGRSLSLNANHRQVLATGETSLTLPNLTFSQGSRKPFKRETLAAGERERWYERITYTYSSSLDNRYDFRRLSDTELLARGDTSALGISWWEALIDPEKYRRATGDETPFDFKASHNLPVSASFSVNRLPVINKTFRLNLASNLSYREDWYIRTFRRTPSDSASTVVTDPTSGFFALRRFTTGVSASSTFYGLFPWRIWRFNGFRHTVRPDASFSYSPDYTSDFWGYYRSYTDRNGREVTYPIVNAAPGREQKTLSLQVSNVFETKYIRTDSTGDAQNRSLKLFDLNFSTFYNLAADSFRVGDLAINARTNILDRVDLTFRSNLSPYRLNAQGTRLLDEYLFSLRNLRFARLTRLDITARTSFRSKNNQSGSPASTPRARMTDPSMIPVGGSSFGSMDPFDAPYYNTDVGYADFAIPWTLNMDFTYSLSKSLPSNTTPRATVNASFDFNVTPNWKVQGRTGYDFVNGELVTTNLVILRNFECWEMSFSWIPFGRYQSYSFDLHVKSGKLRDLLRVRQPRSDIKGRFGSVFQ